MGTIIAYIISLSTLAIAVWLTIDKYPWLPC